MTPWGTQETVVIGPANSIPRKEPTISIRIGLTIATARVILNVLRCYWCHMLGHNATRYKILSSGKELSWRCGDGDHTINGCGKEPRCAMCAAERRANMRHITESLTCLAVKDRMRKGNTSRR